jgi:membrane-bound metal-dependent hydrolase YbcI (DUF457 family)
VYAGHAAIALLSKGLRPRVSLAVLVPVAFGPDWIEWMLTLAGRPNRMVSHSLVSVVACATLVAIVYWLFKRNAGDAAVVWLTYFSHWPADFITAFKPTWPGGPEVGLGLYAHPVADVFVESLVVIACWLVYRRSLPSAGQRSRLGLLVPFGLIVMQVGFHVIQEPEVRAPLREMIAPSGVIGAGVYPEHTGGDYLPTFSPPVQRMSLATFARVFHTSESWRTTRAQAAS